jgi:hypothetical protein
VFLKPGEQAMDVFRVEVSNEVLAGPVLFEAENGHGMVRCFASMSAVSVASAVTSGAVVAIADNSRDIAEPMMVVI